MEENTITLMTVPAEEEDETELNLLDLLATCLLQWKKILALLLIGALLGCGWAYIKNANSKMEPVEIEQAVEDARGQLSEDKAVAVEQLFFQYVNYLNLQKEMRAYYSNLAASDVTVDNTVQMRTEYYIVSDIRNLDTVFIKMAVTEADYQAMRDIAPDEQAGATIYDRVLFTTAYNERVQAQSTYTTSSAYSTPGTVKSSDLENGKNAYLINVELYGNSEEQCRQMMAVIDAAFRREAQELKALDPEIRLEPLGEQFNSNVADYVQNLHKRNLDRMTVSESELNSLTTKVGKFSSEEKNYYDLLQQQYEGTYSSGTGKHVSWKKYTAIGAVIGFVIAGCWVFFPYLMNGKIQSESELESGGKVLNRVFIRGKKNLFGRWAARLIHADETDPTVKADMVATDVGILMEKNGKSAVMLLCNKEDADAADFAEQVRARLLAKNGGLKVCIGNPMCSVDELEMAAQADMGVAFAEMKKSKRSMLREWRQICMRYKLPLAGSVAVRRCWNA